MATKTEKLNKNKNNISDEGKDNNKDEIEKDLSDDSTKCVDEKEENKDPIKELENKLEVAENESKDNYDRMLRTSAEFENYKKRSAREISEFRKYANESIIKDILPVIDNMERALDLSSKNKDINTAILEGVDMTLKGIMKIFENYGVKKIEAFEKPFDPVYHQAVSQRDTDKYPENTVVDELQKGYLIHDRLLRPSMVIVSVKKGPDDSNKNE